MTRAERERWQRRFAESYVEKAAGLWVGARDLLAGCRSTIASDAVKDSGYPLKYAWDIGSVATSLTKNPKVSAMIKQLAADRLQALGEGERRPLSLVHLAKYGRLSSPDYERMASDLSLTVNQLMIKGHTQTEIIAYYFETRRDISRNARFNTLRKVLSDEQMVELRGLYSAYDVLDSVRPLDATTYDRQMALKQRIKKLEKIGDDLLAREELEPKVADGSIFAKPEEIGRAINLGLDIESALAQQKQRLVERFGADLGPELDVFLENHQSFRYGQQWAGVLKRNPTSS